MLQRWSGVVSLSSNGKVTKCWIELKVKKTVSILLHLEVSSYFYGLISTTAWSPSCVDAGMKGIYFGHVTIPKDVQLQCLVLCERLLMLSVNTAEDTQGVSLVLSHCSTYGIWFSDVLDVWQKEIDYYSTCQTSGPVTRISPTGRWTTDWRHPNDRNTTINQHRQAEMSTYPFGQGNDPDPRAALPVGTWNVPRSGSWVRVTMLPVVDPSQYSVLREQFSSKFSAPWALDADLMSINATVAAGPPSLSLFRWSFTLWILPYLKWEQGQGEKDRTRKTK